MVDLEITQRPTKVEVTKSELIVRSTTQRLLVDVENRTVTVTASGPQGPKGAVGEGLNFYEHTQVSASSSWVINHNLGYRPNITVEEAVTGRLIFCGEIHHSVNQVELQFNIPRAGTARLT